MEPAPPQAVSNAPEKRQFSIKSCLGRGGFGEVYRAVMTNATGLETEVAVKVLHHDLDEDSQAIQRLRDEGRMLGTLTHASILRVFDLVVLDGRVGLVLEYVEGQDLSKCITPRVAMPPRALLAVVARVADALRAAWETLSPDGETPLHLIHRDIKPQNIRIGTQGDVKLLDFGVARSSNVGRESETRTGNMVGSYLYMAPECLLENRFGPESDVFALGATLFESLSHQRLFNDQSLRELYVLVLQEDDYRTHIDSAVDALDVPQPIQDLLRRMLDRNRENRPTAAELSVICDDLVDSLPGLTLRRWCKNRQWPPVNEVNGLLDGRTITEATIASLRIADFASEPEPVQRKWDWGVLMGTAGGLFMLMGMLIGMVGVAIALIVVFVPREGGARLIHPPAPGPIGELGASEMIRPVRAVVGIPEPQSAPVGVPRPRARAVLMVESAAAVDVTLVGGGRRYGRGSRVPPGTYTLRVDWGDGPVNKGTATVSPSARTIAVRCNVYTQACSAN